MERFEETGRRIKNIAVTDSPRIRESVIDRHKASIDKMPLQAKMAQEFVDGLQFEAVREMYRTINARSQGSFKSAPPGDKAARSNEIYEPLNNIQKSDVFFDAILDPNDAYKEDNNMRYGSVPNAVIINLSSSTLAELAQLEQQEKLTERDLQRRHQLVAAVYQLLFHELGHAYSYQYANAFLASDGKTYYTIQSGTKHEKKVRYSESATQAVITRTVRDGTFWLEGWNDLQAALLMQEYLHSHSLEYHDEKLNEVDGERAVINVLFYSAYGHASYAIWAIANHIASDTGVPMQAVLQSFTRAFQTKRGADDLNSALKEILGEDIYDRIGGTDVSEEKSRQLAYDIMQKVNAPEHWQEHLLDIITRPD